MDDLKNFLLEKYVIINIDRSNASWHDRRYMNLMDFEGV